MQDPCRPGVRDSVRLCQAAGIKVFSCFCVTFILDASKRDRSPFMSSSIIRIFASSGDVYLKIICLNC
jgi:hypothetical protein